MTLRHLSIALASLVSLGLAANPWANGPQSQSLEIERLYLQFSGEAKALFKEDLERSFIVPKTYENSQGDERYGVTLNWMQDAVHQWQSSFDVSALEYRLNKYPSYSAKVPIGDSTGVIIDIHFMALFSNKPDAIPIALLHGWPGSFMEFSGLFDVMSERYSIKNSPYHLIAPSLPGFTFSGGPPSNMNWGIQDTAQVVDDLLVGLGFDNGYVAQGGDVGSLVAQALSLSFDSCRGGSHPTIWHIRTLLTFTGIHLNFIPSIKPESVPDPRDDTSLTIQDREFLQRSEDFVLTKQAYALEQGTRPSTVGLTLSNNPIGLLAWLGEKFLAWTDPSARMSTAQILDYVSLYHLTGTIARSLYPYKETSTSMSPKALHPPYLVKPFGYSRFQYDDSGVPESWARGKGNMTFYRTHERGGHFAAVEMPVALWADVEEFIKGAFPNGL